MLLWSFPSVLYLVLTVFPVIPPSTHSVQLLAFTIQSPISIGPSCSSMTQKGVSVYYVNQHNVCQCGCVKECWHEWVLPCPVILNDVMFSYLPLLLWTFQFALLFLCAALKSDANSVLRCFCLFLTTVSLPVSFDVLSRTAEHSGIPLKSFFDCNYSYWQSFFFFFF